MDRLKGDQKFSESLLKLQEKEDSSDDDENQELPYTSNTKLSNTKLSVENSRIMQSVIKQRQERQSLMNKKGDLEVEKDLFELLQELQEEEYTWLNRDAFKGEAVYKEYPYRWIVLLVYFMVALASPLMNYTFSPFISDVKEMYDVDNFFMNLQTTFAGILSLAVAMYTNYLMDNSGMYISLTLTASVLIVGSWVKLLVNQSLWFLVIGNCIGGLGRNVILNGSPKTGHRWFLPQNTPIVSALIIACTPVGVFLGYLIPIMYIDEDAIQETGKGQFHDLLFWEAVIITVFSLPVIFFYREKPPTPPSETSETKRISYKQSLPQLFKKRDYYILLMNVIMAEGCAGYFFVNAEQILVPFGFESSKSLYLIAASCLGGFSGAVVHGILVKRINVQKKFKFMLLQAFIFMIVFFVAFNLSLFYTDHFTVSISLFFVLAFFMMPIITLSIELSVIISYPVPEAISSGFLTIGGLLNAFTLSMVSSFFLDETKEGIRNYHTIIFALVFFTFTLNLFLEEKSLARDHMETVLQQERKIMTTVKKQNRTTIGFYKDNRSASYQKSASTNQQTY